MSFTDDVALWQQRLLANDPQASLASTSFLYNLGLAFISTTSDLRFLIDSSAPAMTIAGSSGDALKSKAADYGVAINGGTAATVSLTFSVPTTQASAITIPAGTMVSTQGDGIALIPLSFTTNAASTIPAGSLSVVGVSATCTTTGASGNVLSGSLIIMNQPLLSGTVSSTNPSAATGGTDADTDSTITTNVKAALTSKYGAAAVQAEALTVPGCYDAYCLDPQNGSGTLTLYWCDVNGNSNTVGPTPTIWNSGGTGALQVAVNSVLPPNITINNTTGYTGFTIIPVTVSATYSKPSSILAANLEPQIKTAIVSYIQSLTHGQAVTPALMFQYVQSAVGGVLTYFTATVTPASTPPILLTTLYRCTGTASVTLTLQT